MLTLIALRKSTLSTTKAEYIAVSHACKEEIWLKGLLGEFGRMHNNVTVFYLATNLAYHSMTIHIDIKCHFVIHVIDGGTLDLKRVYTQENYVDMLMKLMLLEKLWWCLTSLGLQKR